MKTEISIAGLVVGAFLVPGIANASLVLDTGTPAGTAMSMVLDGNDYYAAEFNLSTTSVINSVSAYLLAGLDAPGDTYTVSIYADPITARNASPDFSAQGTYQAAGWNTTSTAGLLEGPGNYWVALEVGINDSAIGLNLPIGNVGAGTAPALGFAFNSGSGYTTSGAMPFGVQVDASPVPVPPAIWLLGSGILGIGAAARRRRPAT